MQLRAAGRISGQLNANDGSATKRYTIYHLRERNRVAFEPPVNEPWGAAGQRRRIALIVVPPTVILGKELACTSGTDKTNVTAITVIPNTGLLWTHSTDL